MGFFSFVRGKGEAYVTALLVIAVMASMVWSALIWTGAPWEVAVDRPRFYTTPVYGTHLTARDLLKPQAIWIWRATGQLFRVGGSSRTARTIMSELGSATMTSGGLFPAKTMSLPPSGAYLRIDFGSTTMAPTVLNLALATKGAPFTYPVDGSLYVYPLGNSNRFAIAYRSGDEVFRGLLQGESSLLSSAFTPNSDAMPYMEIPLIDGVLTLPYNSAYMPIEDWQLAHPIPSHIIDSFFVDPTIIQTVSVPHKFTLYTDGSRGVNAEMGPFGEVLQYTDMGHKLHDVSQDTADALAAAIPFINEHGGFVGDQICFLDGSAAGQGREDFTFTSLVGGWPLYSSLDRLDVKVVNGTVVSMWRGLTYLDSRLATRSVRILSGLQLVNMLGPHRLANISSISLGYGTTSVQSDLVELVPVYRVADRDGTTEYLNATDGAKFTGSGM